MKLYVQSATEKLYRHRYYIKLLDLRINQGSNNVNVDIELPFSSIKIRDEQKQNLIDAAMKEIARNGQSDNVVDIRWKNKSKLITVYNDWKVSSSPLVIISKSKEPPMRSFSGKEYVYTCRGSYVYVRLYGEHVSPGLYNYYDWSDRI